MFRFTIRDVLLATAIVALAIGWWIDRTRLASKLESTSERLSVLEAVVGAGRWTVTYARQGDRISQITVTHK
jgi:hypothetical protein